MSSPPIFNLGSAQNTPEKRGRKKKLVKQLSISDDASTTIQGPSSTLSADRAKEILQERDNLNNGLISADEHHREASRSPRRRTFSEKTLSHFLKEDEELFKQALDAEDSLLSVKEETEKQVKEQWINLGGGTDIRVLYPTPYPESIKNAPLFFVCPFCMKPISEEHSFFVHQVGCLFKSLFYSYSLYCLF
ncbi:unnamed protein product [Cylicostephanus goldi]|uniref:MYST zinc finger domain-containing protein n=1 Tax=Cylicostephanus goldi TaxID=71465 RepID=A0A3P6R0D9_CYLGO|nr:unnamed protein product [Cylicostephanus goldi]